MRSPRPMPRADPVTIATFRDVNVERLPESELPPTP